MSDTVPSRGGLTRDCHSSRGTAPHVSSGPGSGLRHRSGRHSSLRTRTLGAFAPTLGPSAPHHRGGWTVVVEDIDALSVGVGSSSSSGALGWEHSLWKDRDSSRRLPCLPLWTGRRRSVVRPHDPHVRPQEVCVLGSHPTTGDRVWARGLPDGPSPPGRPGGLSFGWRPVRRPSRGPGSWALPRSCISFSCVC